MLLSVPLLIALNAFFVASEYAVVAIRPVQIAALRKRGRTIAAATMERLRADSASTIGTIQVCITVTNLVLGWLGEPAISAVLHRLLGPLAAYVPEAVWRPVTLVISFLVVTLLTVVFSELLPKALTLRFVETVASFTAVPVRWIGFVVWPLVWVMNQMANAVTLPLGLGRIEEVEGDTSQASVEELRLLATEAAKEGVLTPRERTLILNTLALNDRTARTVMVPRVQVAFLDLQNSMQDNMQVLNARLYNRLPLCNGGLDHIVGVVSTKAFLTAYHAEGDTAVLQLVADDATFAPEIATTGHLLALFNTQKTDFIILVDEYGGVAGIVTLQDVVDDLLGVVDESKALLQQALHGDLTRPAGKRVVAGDLPVHELAQLLVRPEWPGETTAATVGGLVVEHLGHVPAAGEQVTVEGIKLKVTRSDKRAVRQVEVEVLPAVTEPTA